MASAPGIAKRSVTIQGHRTSISLEAEFLTEIERIAARSGKPFAALIAEIDAARDPRTNLSSAVRLHVLEDLRRKAGAGG